MLFKQLDQVLPHQVEAATGRPTGGDVLGEFTQINPDGQQSGVFPAGCALAILLLDVEASQRVALRIEARAYAIYDQNRYIAQEEYSGGVTVFF